MIIVSYDISDVKLQAQFRKMIMGYGRRLQMSVYELNNSPRTLANVLTEIDLKFRWRFKETDSVIIIPICKSDQAKIKRMGWAVHEEEKVILF
jgi:CRISPR-associated protein Cas2